MMMPLPEAMIAIWAPFAVLFTQPVWHHVQTLWMGAVLCCPFSRSWPPRNGRTLLAGTGQPRSGDLEGT
jgi:hypothetical protein